MKVNKEIFIKVITEEILKICEAEDIDMSVILEDKTNNKRDEYCFVVKNGDKTPAKIIKKGCFCLSTELIEMALDKQSPTEKRYDSNGL